jgi:hypothetical protein
MGRLNEYMVGLAVPNNLVEFASIDYAFQIESNGTIGIREKGIQKNVTGLGYVAEGDVYKISKEGSSIKYYKNGAVLRTVNLTSPPAQWIVDICVYRGNVPRIMASFFRSPKTFYSIANGNWKNFATWSHTVGGPAATIMPALGDNVTIRGHAVAVTSGIVVSKISINVTDPLTKLLVDGASALLEVHGDVKISGGGNTAPNSALTVSNNAAIKVVNQ